MNIVFFGSDDFALKSLEKLIGSKFQISACVTQVDKPKGRGLKVAEGPIKQFAVKNSIPVLQPAKLSDLVFIDELRSFNSDLFVVIAYGKILPKEVLSTPKLFCVNVHGSLLPKYRGAAPINWAILNGDKKTGVTIIKMNPYMDAGDIISQEELIIREDDTAVTLREKMAEAGAELLLKTIQSIEKNSHTSEKQDLSQVSYAPKLSKELGVIKWDEKAQAIYNSIRGLVPWPSAYTYFNGKVLKILEAEIRPVASPKAVPGEVVFLTKEGFVVAALKDALHITKVHLESGKPMDAKSFAAGHKLHVGYKFR